MPTTSWPHQLYQLCRRPWLDRVDTRYAEGDDVITNYNWLTCFCSHNIGLPVKNPVDSHGRPWPVKRAAVGRSVQRKQGKRSKDDSDSEEEWQPWMEDNRQKPSKRRGTWIYPTLHHLLRMYIIMHIVTKFHVGVCLCVCVCVCVCDSDEEHCILSVMHIHVIQSNPESIHHVVEQSCYVYYNSVTSPKFPLPHQAWLTRVIRFELPNSHSLTHTQLCTLTLAIGRSTSAPKTLDTVRRDAILTNITNKVVSQVLHNSLSHIHMLNS